MFITSPNGMPFYFHYTSFCRPSQTSCRIKKPQVKFLFFVKTRIYKT